MSSQLTCPRPVNADLSPPTKECRLPQELRRLGRQSLPQEPGCEGAYLEMEEGLIVDVRAYVRPSEMVENKLVSLLNSAVPISHVRTSPLCRGRSRG